MKSKGYQRDSYVLMFKAALVTITKIWNCLRAHKWMNDKENKMCKHNGIYSTYRQYIHTDVKYIHICKYLIYIIQKVNNTLYFFALKNTNQGQLKEERIYFVLWFQKYRIPYRKEGMATIRKGMKMGGRSWVIMFSSAERKQREGEQEVG